MYDLIGDDLDYALEGWEDDDDLDSLEGYGEEIVGDDDDDDLYMDELDMILSGSQVGARRRPRRRRRSRRPPPRKFLERVSNRQLRRYPLGLGATSIGAGATAIISANPQLPFQVNRLVTPSVGLLIDNLQVGTVAQFVAAGAVPTEVFAPNAVSVSLKGDTAVPGVSVQITISNPTGAPIVFSGAIIGSVAQ